MGIFGGSTSPFDQLVEKVTDEKNTGEDWGMIMSVCDRVGATQTGPKDCLKSLIKRLNHQDPHVVMQAITLLDACVNNCGKYFLLEVASREFENEFKKLLSKSHPKIVEKLKSMLKRWAEGEFSKDAQYSLIPSLYSNLKKEGMDFSGGEGQPKKKELPADPLVVSSQQEEDDLAKAIQMSLQETKGGGGGGGRAVSSSASVLYPVDSLYSGAQAALDTASSSVGGAAAAQPIRKEEEKRARALYDFEAAEDNELTFKAGEVVLILDDADPNWWKGSNHRGEGLFPSNFVTMELDGAGERKRSVVFNEEVEVKEVEQVTFPAQETIDQGKIDQLLAMLHDADPTTGEADPPDLPRLEEQVSSMGPLIDTELERTDRRHAQLTRLSHELVDALSLYHTLMREMPGMPSMSGMPPYQGMPGMYPGYAPGMQAGPPMQGGQGGSMGYMPQHMGGPPPGMGVQGMGPQGQPPVSMGGPGLPPVSMGGPGQPPVSMGGPGMGGPQGPTQMGGPGQQMMGQGAPGMGGPPVSVGMPMSSMPQQNGAMVPPPGMYGYMDPSLYQQQQQHYMSMMPGTAPPPTPPLQEQQQPVQPGHQM